MAAFIAPTGAPVRRSFPPLRPARHGGEQRASGSSVGGLFDGVNVLAPMCGHRFTVVAESIEFCDFGRLDAKKMALMPATALQLARDGLQTAATSG